MSDGGSTSSDSVISVYSSAFKQTNFQVRDFAAHESVGRPFLIEVQLVAEDTSLSFATALGSHLSLQIELSHGNRFLDGIVTQFAYVGQSTGGAIYQATLRPWLWLLKRNVQTRIYQNKTVPDIIKDVFKRAGYDAFDDKTGRPAAGLPFATLEYCVQYQESDFDFVHRLMEREGLYYFFTHVLEEHKLVLADGTSSHSTYDSDCETIAYRSSETGSDAEGMSVSYWIATQEIQSATVLLRDRNYDTAPNAMIDRTKSIKDDKISGIFEIYEYPGKYAKGDEADTYVELRRQEQVAKFARAHGATMQRWIAAGCLVTLKDAPRKDLNCEYLILDTVMESRLATGAAAQGIETKFLVMPSSYVYRMPRETPRPYIRGPQTALVTGKSGEEIFTDKYARVKVQFYWDRYGKKDESSSCWIRCTQPWADKGWGSVFIPRIGQEVVVHFIEGDPDQPIITGAVYNGPDDPSPISLPDNATQSTIKTNSSKGGGGFNQIRFEDKKGSEELFVQAQKDYNITVLNNRAITVTQDLTETVQKGNRSITVSQGNETKEITQGSQTLKVVQGKQTVTINGDQSITIQTGNHSLTVSAGTSTISSPQSITLKVGANSVVIDTSGVTIKGMNVTVQGQLATKVTGLTTDVEGSAETNVKGGIVMVN